MFVARLVGECVCDIDGCVRCGLRQQVEEHLFWLVCVQAPTIIGECSAWPRARVPHSFADTPYLLHFNVLVC